MYKSKTYSLLENSYVKFLEKNIIYPFTNY